MAISEGGNCEIVTEEDVDLAVEKYRKIMAINKQVWNREIEPGEAIRLMDEILHPEMSKKSIERQEG